MRPRGTLLFTSSCAGTPRRRAKKAGIPVVLINREIPVDDIALEQITHNNFQAGSEVANVFVEKMAEKGKYAELTCNLADNNCVTRSKSFHQVIDQYPVKHTRVKFERNHISPVGAALLIKHTRMPAFSV